MALPGLHSSQADAAGKKIPAIADVRMLVSIYFSTASPASGTLRNRGVYRCRFVYDSAVRFSHELFSLLRSALKKMATRRSEKLRYFARAFLLHPNKNVCPGYFVSY